MGYATRIRGRADSISAVSATNGSASATTRTADPDRQCLTAFCFREAVTRGLCKSCYVTATRLIREHRTSWLELEDLGLAARSERRRGKFQLAFKRAKAEEGARAELARKRLTSGGRRSNKPPPPPTPPPKHGSRHAQDRESAGAASKAVAAGMNAGESGM